MSGPAVRLGVCSVGTELLTGDQVDSNATWIAGRARACGATAVLHVAVRDVHEEIVDAIGLLLDRCDMVVVGGGLGPTPDDRTREAVAEVAGVPLQARPDLADQIAARFAALGATMSPNNARQARVPVGATPIAPVGTAPGFRVDVDGCPVWVLPGVPWELQVLFDREVAPTLVERSGGHATATRSVHVVGLGESMVADRLADLEARAAAAGIELAYLAGRGQVDVKLTAIGPTLAAATDAAGRWVDEVVATLGRSVTGVDGDTVEQAVHRLLRDAGATVAVAESATAGTVCARLADVPGASAVLRGGAVVYATDTKATVAGIDPRLLDEHPPVSEAVTGALAQQVRARFGADYGLATTGVAGPDEQDGVAVGTCVWAVCGPDGRVEVRQRVLPGDRATIRTRLATGALESLRRRLLSDRDA